MYFGYVVHRQGRLVAQGGRYAEEDKVLADGHGTYTGWTLVRFAAPGNRNFKDVQVGDKVDLLWRPTYIPPHPPDVITETWDSRALTVTKVVSLDSVLVSESQSFPPVVKVAYKVTRHVANEPPPAEEIDAAVAKAKGDGAILYHAEEPILPHRFSVKDGVLVDDATKKKARIALGFDRRGLMSRMWARVTGGG